ncbi:fasciclin domain-containing protein [Anditalea andensis]|uniref:FAS1 domain-containing protein n=1 Tax=Anditalea andensis TaxID=1048983 RepID=A0A074KXT4_9BACT|nr:fasciclin domain-containing protein [Anditalea andensis]KEO73754.1 hypothetical protein EL17_09565 [Anditalea andensis]
MKLINNKLKIGTVSLVILMIGATGEVHAQGGMQTQSADRPAATIDTQMDYQDIFKDVTDTENHSALDLLKQDDNFSTFIELLEKSGLEKSVKAQEEITIFAPTNEAFKQMRKAEYDRLLDDKNRGDLIRVIQAHMVPRKIYASEFQSNHVLESADGDDIEIQTAGEVGAGAMPDAIIVGGAQIMRHDVETNDGLIHITNRIVRTDGNVTAFY